MRCSGGYSVDVLGRDECHDWSGRLMDLRIQEQEKMLAVCITVQSCRKLVQSAILADGTRINSE